jgi:serine/threonine protein kinase
VLYETLTGEVPFPGENFVAVAMKHINEPPPSLLERRPDIPVRLATAVERALAKDPGDRFPSMEAFCAELRACLAELGDPDSARTFIQPAPVLRESAPRRAGPRRRRWPLYLLLLLALAAILAALFALRGSKSDESSQTQSGGGGSAPVSLSATRAFDPSGDGAEHDSAAANATDGNSTTYWDTEHYISGLAKPGVGLVLDAGRPRVLSSITVQSSTPGFTAEILSGNAVTTDMKVDGASQTVGSQTTFDLRGASARYYVLWITDLGTNSSVRVNEITARG